MNMKPKVKHMLTNSWLKEKQTKKDLESLEISIFHFSFTFISFIFPILWRIERRWEIIKQKTNGEILYITKEPPLMRSKRRKWKTRTWAVKDSISIAASFIQEPVAAIQRLVQIRILLQNQKMKIYLEISKESFIDCISGTLNQRA